MAKPLNIAVLNVAATLPIDDSAVSRRLDRAENDILRGYGYSIAETGRAGQYCITKASTSLLEDNEHSYIVSSQSCNCPDFESARGNLCKHRLAVMILEEMQR